MIAQKTMRGFNKGPIVNRPRREIENMNDPRGQFASLLRHWLDKHHHGDGAPLAKSLGVSLRTIQTWAKGQAGPPLADLNRVALALGFSDWSKLAAAAVKHSRTA